MIADLADISWKGRTVWIGFDFDRYRNPGVNLAAAELARVIADLGANVTILKLPPGPRGADGLPSKMAVDDFVVRYGEPQDVRESRGGDQGYRSGAVCIIGSLSRLPLRE